MGRGRLTGSGHGGRVGDGTWQLSRVIMGEGKPKIRKLKEGAVLTEQGEEADAIYLLLDGVIQVLVDGKRSPTWAREP